MHTKITLTYYPCFSWKEKVNNSAILNTRWYGGKGHENTDLKLKNKMKIKKVWFQDSFSNLRMVWFSSDVYNFLHEIQLFLAENSRSRLKYNKTQNHAFSSAERGMGVECMCECANTLTYMI